MGQFFGPYITLEYNANPFKKIFGRTAGLEPWDHAGVIQSHYGKMVISERPYNRKIPGGKVSKADWTTLEVLHDENLWDRRHKFLDGGINPRFLGTLNTRKEIWNLYAYKKGKPAGTRGGKFAPQRDGGPL